MRIVERGVIFGAQEPPGHRVACFPSLARLADGRLLCTFRVGSTKDSADETIRIVESADEGRTWRLTPFAPSTALGRAPGSLRLAHLVETAPAHLVLAASWVGREDPAAPIANPRTGGCLPLKLVTFHSPDGGRTWSGARAIPTPFGQPELSGPLVSLAGEGRVLLPVETQKEYDDPAPIDQRAYALLSDDHGRTWPDWALIAHDPDRHYWCHRIARLPDDDRLIDLTWTYDVRSGQDLPIHLISGSAAGRRWATPVSTGVAGQLATPLALDSTTLLMAYVHRHAPPSIRLRASRDGGRSWDAAEELVLYAPGRGGQTGDLGGAIPDYYRFMTHYTFGFTPLARLSDAEMLVAYFAGTATATSIRWVRVEHRGTRGADAGERERAVRARARPLREGADG